MKNQYDFTTNKSECKNNSIEANEFCKNFETIDWGVQGKYHFLVACLYSFEYHLYMFKKGISKLEILFNKKYNLKLKQIREPYRIKLAILKEVCNKNGTLHSGYFSNQYIKLHLDIVKEIAKALYDTYRSVYCPNGINKKHFEALYKRIDFYEKNNLNGFNNKLDDEQCINAEFKLNVKTEYKWELNRILNELKNIIEIDYLEGNKPDIVFEKNQAEAPTIIKQYLGLRIFWKSHKLFVIIFCIIFIIFILFYKEITEWARNFILSTLFNKKI